MNRRRRLLVALGASAFTAPFSSLAQQQGKVWRIGFLSLRRPDSMDSDFIGGFPRRADSIFVLNTPANFNNRKLLIQIAGKTRLPAIYGTDSYAESGGLISYGSNDKTRWQQAARFVDRILKGAKPADLPIEQPTKFDLVINMKTARALGIKIPQSVLARADRVIE